MVADQCNVISGTLTPVLTFLVYELARSPTHVNKMREELSTINNIKSNQELQKLPHLNAFINETLRVHPPILDGLPRTTPPEGITIKGQAIPGGVTCLAPIHTISRRKHLPPSLSSFTHPKILELMRKHSRNRLRSPRILHPRALDYIPAPHQEPQRAHAVLPRAHELSG